jgi:hypothetical protein
LNATWVNCPSTRLRIETEFDGVTDPNPLKYTGRSIRRAATTVTGTLGGPAARVEAAALEFALLHPARTVTANRAQLSPHRAAALLAVKFISKMIPFHYRNQSRMADETYRL